ncbi:histone-lysine N-methyltransferase PRDM16-like [Daktulosphaira vitifoliae]|uniref:histone-lysine N-methyltransferase PRDM16-like n=1 Tax=Daktulosphaira vitifoliae TaxID=58002 RepID=UPI0021A9E575|nr:histone-lysine N-methyltransferase PRDM16-like [Daktulosphaira vitifoliae]
MILLICLIFLFLERLVCPNGCGRSYNYRKGLSHQSRYEYGYLKRIVDSLFTCPNQNCYKSYKTKGNLMRHLKYECGKSPKYACPYCNKKSSLKFNLKKHIAVIHNTVANPLILNVD